ncbi:hypothetical protein PG993_012956 [Apiospora rasikravindrae]|uniref:DUF1682-domain-containing protein n=1 Tax=Apiospora rasikravindrae TaxID=990691 RepID=A0ABR1RYC0_9PEZI
MANFLKNIVGTKSSETAVPSADSDFADFADAPSPTPVAFDSAGATLGSPGATATPFTKWYNVHERHSLSEFKAEGAILLAMVLVFTLHFFGTRLNKAKAKAWAKAHTPILASEFSLVGFGGVPQSDVSPDNIFKQKSLFEFATYATGRQNVAFTDVKLTLKKRFNPLMTFVETASGFFFESFAVPQDIAEAITYPFDGREAAIVPAMPGAAELRTKDSKSTYDGFVWAIVNKENMKKLREDRYDLSITFTKDTTKLPNYLTVMSESAEITDTLLTNDLITAVQKAGDLFEYLIISDQPIDKPTKIDETTPRKRMYLKYRLPSDNNYDMLTPLFNVFLRFPDHLAASAHFRAEVLRKVRSVRDELVKTIQKNDEENKAEERALERDKARKAKRDAELSSMDAKTQKKFLEKEREKQMRKQSKRQTMRA